MEYYKKENCLVRDSVKEDIEKLKDHLRESDVIEIWNSHHLIPEDALEISFEDSELCLTIEKNGIPIGMFGITPPTLLADTASVWLLATQELETLNKSFVKESKGFIEMFLARYPTLENYIDANNIKSFIWLKRCGAKIDPPALYGVEKKLFRHFTFRREDA